MNEKFLICRPRGGLNDTLCQIQRCLSYSEKYKRNLIFDTRQSGLFTDFSSIFSLRGIALSSISDISKDNDQFFPRIINNISEEITSVTNNTGKVLDKKTGTLITFDFAKDYSEPVLIHEQFGGGKDSLRLLDRLEIVKDIQATVQPLLESLGQNYAAIHVRNSDYQTDYIKWFEIISPKLIGKSILVCSDDARVIRDAVDLFPKSYIFGVDQADASLRDLMPAIPLHAHGRYSSDKDRLAATAKSIVDLISLANARELHIATVTQGLISGYSTLAAHLCEHRSTLASFSCARTPTQPGEVFLDGRPKYIVDKINRFTPKPFRQMMWNMLNKKRGID